MFKFVKIKKYCLYFSSIFFSLIITGCAPNLSKIEIDSLHQPYPLSKKELTDIATKVCREFPTTKEGRARGLRAYTNTFINVDIIGEIEKTYTKNPFGSADFSEGISNSLENKPTPIYKGSCRIVTRTVQDGLTYSHLSSGEDPSPTVYVIHFVIDPKACLSKEPHLFQQCGSMDFSPISLINSAIDTTIRPH